MSLLKSKKNGETINPNDPQEEGTRTQAPSTPSRAESQGDIAKVPQFGAWDSNGDDVGYTAYFENARKTHGDTQMNRDVAKRPKSEQQGHVSVRRTSRDGSETPNRGGRQTPQHPRAGKSQLTPSNASRGSHNSEKGTAIPQFGVWNTNPGQAEDFTGTFLRARADRNAPLGKNTPVSQHQKTQEATKTSCFPCFR